MQKSTGASRVIFALKGKRKKAVESIKPFLLERGWEFYLSDDIYPAGDEQVLVYETTGRVVPPAGIPLEIGVVVQNVGTLTSISDASDGKPLVSKRVTITGAVLHPATFSLPLGISFQQAINLAGGTTTPNSVALEGGPMTGKLVENLNQPIVKTTGGITVLPDSHPLIRQRLYANKISLHRSRTCIQCFYCTLTCPRYLLGHPLYPHLLSRSVSYGMVPKEFADTAVLCCECNICELYACPAGVFPRGVNVYLKNEVVKQKRRYQRPDKIWKPQVDRYARLLPTRRLISRLGLNNFPLEVEENTVIYSPAKVKLPLKQHIGVPAVPVKKTGDRVEKGELIADIPQGSVGARVHVSISGKIIEINDSIVIKADAKN
ncbi:MAG: Electron transport complex subunit RnfC [candidate division WS2 bacterium]|nr:Electron transport complex subunit RnfC [Candidatus Lithacetigena glycinireducens]